MYIGLDLGTSGLKALLVDEAQAIVGEAQTALEVTRPHEGWCEQSPADWVAATCAAMDRLAAEFDLSGVRAVGLSGQMHGATLLDRANDVLRPCILWNDTRSHAEAAEMDADPIWRATTGNIVFPGFTAPKLAWVRVHEPGIFDRTAMVLLPKDYLRLWLTGEFAAEMSDASGTSWLDVERRDWSDALLAGTELSRDQMPQLVEGNEVSGKIRGELAKRWGLGASTVVAGGGGDNAATAIGTGVVKDGDGFISLGTSGVLFAANDGFRPDPDQGVHTFCHALPKTWHQMGVILAATDALNWFAGLTSKKPSALTSELAELRAPGRSLFLPYLGGERTPINDPSVRGAMIGLEHETDLSAATRAVIEGVTFAIRDCFDAISETGTRFRKLYATGGGSKSTYWLRALATALETPILVPKAGDFGAAFGAARLAMLADGAEISDVATPPAVEHTIEPDIDLVAAFSDAQSRYRATYRALKELS